MNLKRNVILTILIFTSFIYSQTVRFTVPGTNVTKFYDNSKEIPQPKQGEPFYGQDAQYPQNKPSYTDNGDGTITDNVTGLMWQKDMGEKIYFSEAQTKADNLTLGGHEDWRLPTVTELYSLIVYTGRASMEGVIKFIDTTNFIQPTGSPRPIDAQTLSSTKYISTTMGGSETVFGVNFCDGRIKGYPISKKWYFRMVRGEKNYGKNKFVDNGDGTITDKATGLMWQKADDGKARNWKDALAYSENLSLADYSDWRLPNAKELQSIVDYSRAPAITQSPAINPLFKCTEIKDLNGKDGHYPFYWTSTTHLDGPRPGGWAVYVTFGEAHGKMQGTVIDVHGAGAQRSDPKDGDPADYPKADPMSPQGDVQRVFNHVRCVRNADVSPIKKGNTGNIIQNGNTTISLLQRSNKITISLSADKYSPVEIKIYTIKGEHLNTLRGSTHKNGQHSFNWNIENRAKGTYLAILTIGKETIQKRFTLTEK